MLELKNITKSYLSGEDSVAALKGVNLKFRENEFVAILGPSGCGKTTLLNIVGGLDHYTSGDLVIDGVSTKQYLDRDWDAYRNHRIGFVFQSYHLIPHLNVTENVEMALTLSGVGGAERKRRAEIALEKVGLAGQMKKRPNQMSGGQMQRVSIARALVNDPDIILADEPTGALDSSTSVQIMNLLQKIAKEKLVIMVTHNAELAEKYATRIIRILDGNAVSDTAPLTNENFVSEKQESAAADSLALENTETVRTENIAENSSYSNQIKEESAWKAKLLGRFRRKQGKEKKPAMAFATALKLSLKNLMTKKVRTFSTAFAGSIGIIGVSLVLAISNGFSAYISKIQTTTMASFPLVVSSVTYDQDAMMSMSPISSVGSSDMEAYPDNGYVVTKETAQGGTGDMEDMMNMFKDMIVVNKLTDDYFAYVGNLNPAWGQVHYKYLLETNLLTKDKEGIAKILDTRLVNWQTLIGGKDFVAGQYDLLKGKYPENAFQAVVIIDKYNRLSGNVLDALGLDSSRTDIKLEELLGGNIKYAENDGFYKEDEKGVFHALTNSVDVDAVYDGEFAKSIEIVGVLRIKEGVDFEVISSGIGYDSRLTDYAFEHAGKIGEAQKEHPEIDVTTGRKFQITFQELMMGEMTGMKINEETKYKESLQKYGADKTPSEVYIFPKDFQTKGYVKNYLDDYNTQKINEGKEDEKVVYSDMAETVTQMMNEIIRIISIVLICFAAISLVVSSVMISIITYVSVVERTKEIGILRSLGARKLDIFNVFNAETVLIGLTSGIVGVVATYILSIPINAIINALTGLNEHIAALAPYNAILMIGISVLLTFVAGLIPARIAAKKDPVVALRTE